MSSAVRLLERARLPLPQHFPQHERTVAELVSRIRRNARRYVALFSEVIDALMPEPTKDISEYDEVIDVILHQRKAQNQSLEAGQQQFPDHLLRR